MKALGLYIIDHIGFGGFGLVGASVLSFLFALPLMSTTGALGTGLGAGIGTGLVMFFAYDLTRT